MDSYLAAGTWRAENAREREDIWCWQPQPQHSSFVSCLVLRRGIKKLSCTDGFGAAGRCITACLPTRVTRQVVVNRLHAACFAVDSCGKPACHDDGSFCPKHGSHLGNNAIHCVEDAVPAKNLGQLCG